MAYYTVKKLSQISGVTIHTLHFYEEVALLNPAYYGSNGYRYYEEKELFQLQQILFFKKLGLTLKQIGKIIGKTDFDQIAALYSHRHALICEREKISHLLKTIDKTIKHLKGKGKMKGREFFDGFNLVKKASEREPYFTAEKIVLESLKKKALDAIEESKRLDIAKVANQIYGQLANCLEKGMIPSSDKVQKLIKKHCEFAGKFYEISKNVYKALAKLYSKHPEYRKQLDPIHPDLAIFVEKAMDLFADRTLV